MAIKRMEALELAEVLGSLLGSVIDAQAESARATVAFVDEVGFESTTGADRLRTVKLRYTKKDENGEPAEFEVEVPLLAMVNVPSLAVREAKLAFSYDIVTATSANSSSGSSLSSGSNRLLSRIANLRAAKMTGFVKRKTTGVTTGPERRTTSIELDVTLEQQEVPIGVERLFDLAELGITERTVLDSVDPENGGVP